LIAEVAPDNRSRGDSQNYEEGNPDLCSKKMACVVRHELLTKLSLFI
jgi:hypothetical protein